MKTCTKCNETKPVSEYYKSKLGKGGLRANCKSCSNEFYYEYCKKNPEKINSQRREYWHKNPEKCRQYNLKWSKNNPDKKASMGAKRRAKSLNATPKWLTQSQINIIEAFYTASSRLSKCIGIPHEVDHIIPLQGPGVSGLHVPWNLQILPASINRSKGNKL